MIKSFKIVNNLNQTLELDINKPEDSGFLISSVTGLTYLQAEISTADIALFDGSILGNRRVGKRNIVMNIVFYEDNRQKLSIEELRHKCYKFFPIKQKVRFYVTNDSGTYWIDGYIEANEINIFTKQEGAQISILCPDPYFVKTEADISQLVSKIEPNFSFPCSFEFEGEPVPGYPNKYEGPFLIIPEGFEKVIETKDGYSYGDIVVARYIAEREENETGGDTVTIKGDDTVEEIIPTEPEQGVEWNKYEGPTTITPIDSNITLPTGLTYIDDDITIKEIPIEKFFVSKDGHLDNYIIRFGQDNYDSLI